MSIIDKIIFNFKSNKSLYIGEGVTMSEHMIQSAMLAEKANCEGALICSCLLHDYGHFIIEDPDELVSNEKDGEHESVGYEYLKKYFSKKVVDPIKYHVLAKRYLARKESYYQKLSNASRISLKLQGGILSDKESEKFENKEYFKNTILLRKFDEAAKIIDKNIKPIDEYKNILSSNLL